ncbi:MAG: hypothetical protein E7357_01530 [Clostridiales bacterium]|nr:hypothetical protein [Clostridiales bacterium]
MNGWKRKTAVVFLACVSVMTSSGCSRDDPSAFLDDVITRENYESVYGAIGSRVTIDQVYEKEYGKAYVVVDGKEYELGMDFLSMAMVYNAKPAGAFTTAKSAYEEWWRLYMRRWNYLVPEVPLYSNQYYDVYNAKIDKLQTNPYWDVSDAIVSSRVIKGENAVVLGSNTELTGAFRDAAFGKSSAGAADLDIQSLTSGYSTVVTDMGGSLVWAGEDIVRFHGEEKNADGTKTFTIRIAEDLTFSDGSKITAGNYLAPLLVGSSKVFKTAGGSDTAGLALMGYEPFNAYDGADKEQPFSGVRLLDDYNFQVIVKPEYADYYYALKYGVFTPAPLALYLGDYKIKDDGDGAYIEKGFYEKTQKNGVQTYAMADTVAKNLSETSARVFPYSGPYYVDKYEKSSKTATLKRNPFYKGDIRGNAKIETVSFVKIVSETQLDQLKKGRVDVLAGVTGGEETKAALSIVDGVKFKETHYDRAGYGKLAFRCDFGPTQFAEVRRAIMHTIDRNEFAQTFTGGYGSVVDAPYYVGSDTYLAVKDRLGLNKYGYSIEKAKGYLRDGGWVYNADGSAYDEKKGGVRYKKLTGYERSHANLAFAATDNKYKTVKVGGEYYMPLVINWIGTQPNPVTDQLLTAWQNNPNANAKIGAYITYSSGDMTSALYGEYYQMPAYGFKKARYGAVNFATGFTSAVYDQSFAWTIDREMYQNYSSNFLMDEADFLNG